MVLNSGVVPGVTLRSSLGATVVCDEGTINAVAGSNAITFTAKNTTSCVVNWRNFAATNFEITNLKVREIL